MTKGYETMKKRVRFFLVLMFAGFSVLGCAGKQTGDSSEGHEALKESDVITEREESQKRKTSSEDQDAEEHNVSDQDKQSNEKEGSEKKGILIAIDPGHQSPNIDMSGQEPNAPGSGELKQKSAGGTTGRFTGIPEYELNLEIALRLRDCLVEQGYDVILTRENNETAISNAERACLANDAGADFSLRIHANGSEDPAVNGAMALIGSAENPYVGSFYEESYCLAEQILNSYCSSTGMQNLGIRCNDTMTGINWSRIPVVIIEMGFMTNEQDDINMADDSYRELMVNGITEGINAYFGF